MCVWLQGKLYLKKGTVVDVHQPTVCDVVVDDPSQRVSGEQLPQRRISCPSCKVRGWQPGEWGRGGAQACTSGSWRRLSPRKRGPFC